MEAGTAAGERETTEHVTALKARLAESEKEMREAAERMRILEQQLREERLLAQSVAAISREKEITAELTRKLAVLEASQAAAQRQPSSPVRSDSKYTRRTQVPSKLLLNQITQKELTAWSCKRDDLPTSTAQQIWEPMSAVSPEIQRDLANNLAACRAMGLDRTCDAQSLMDSQRTFEQIDEGLCVLAQEMQTHEQIVSCITGCDQYLHHEGDVSLLTAASVSDMKKTIRTNARVAQAAFSA